MATRKKQQRHLEELVRSQGVPARPHVAPLVSEVRSDDVPVYPYPTPLKPDGKLGIVIIWEFCLSYNDIQEFHDFLRKNEAFIADSLKKVTEGAEYLGTYQVIAGCDPCCRDGATDVCYRVIWSYASLETLASAWRSALSGKKNFYNVMARFRAFWLRDPHRSEARMAPASIFFDPGRDSGDAFAKLTLDAAKLNASGGRPRRGSGSA